MMKIQVSYLQRLFFDLWNDFGSVYLLVNHSERTRIGRRGFTDEEKKSGLVLVFNSRTNTELTWDEEGNLSCVLAFGARKEDVFIHHDDLRGVFSPEAGVQFFRSMSGAPPEGTSERGLEGGPGAGGQVVSMSTYRKKRT